MKKPKESAVDKLKNTFIIIDDAHSFFCTLPAQVMLPYCPNYGLFGKYGLYSESKLEKLLDGWYAESWGSKQVFMFCINMLISQGSIITPELRISPAQSFAITVCGSAQFTPTGKGIIDKACNIWKKIIAD